MKYVCLYGWMVVCLVVGTDLRAAMMLRISDGTNQKVIVDGGALDLNILLDVITFSGSLGPNYPLNVATGLGNGLAELDLNLISVVLGPSKTLYLELVQTGYSGSEVTALVGGTMTGNRGSVRFESWATSDDVDFGVTGPYVPLSFVNATEIFSGTEGGPAGVGGVSFTTSAYSASALRSVPYSNFSLVEVVRIQSGPGTGRMTVSFDLDQLAVPEPSTFVLVGGVGLGLVFGVFRRRKASKRKGGMSKLPHE